MLRSYLGGVGLGCWLLARETKANVDPLGAESAIAFAFSPLVGTPLTTSAKLAVVGKSPLSGRISDSLSSSHFAISAKRAGLDALVVTGARRGLSVLVIDGGQAHLEDASDLAGLSATAVDERLRARLGRDWRVAAIGVAGERLVRYATISNDGRHAGRGGLGAVMGAKGLKAIAVRGREPVPVADPERVVQLARDLSQRSFSPATEKYRELGTVANLLVFNRMQLLPTRNFQAGSFGGAEAISAEALAPVREKARASCAACTIGCEHIYGFGGGKGGAAGSTRIEYESMFALGSLLGIGDPDIVLAAAARCDELGIDTISAGGTLAFTMEAAERGLLQSDDPPRFGDGDRMLAALDDIGHRRGLGDLMAEGSRAMAARLGAGSEAFACHVKGLELPGYEPRGLHTMALGLAVGTRGADHNRSGAYEADLTGLLDRFGDEAEAHAVAAATSEDRAALIDSMILCKFLRGVFADLPAESAELLGAVTGWELTGEELIRTAQRIVCARKLYNIREGWTRAEDTLPERFLEEDLGGGATLTRTQLDAMIAAYYRVRGWTPEGLVPPEVVADLCPRSPWFTV